MNKKYQGISVLLATIMLIANIFSGMSAYAQTQESISIGLLADSHLSSNLSVKARASLENALDVFSQTNPNYDGLVMAGDIIMHHYNMVNFVSGQTEISDTINNSGYTAFKSLLAEKGIVTLNSEGEISASNKKLLYAAGNHEFPQNTDITKDGHSEVADASKQMFTEEMGMPLLADEIIGGYHFITAFPEDYELGLSRDSESFIMEKISSSVEEDSNRPVFLIMHTAPYNTTYPSTTQSYSDTFVEFLENTPQLIMITGHMHTTQYDPRMVWQDGYTVISLSCLDESASEKSETAMLEITDNVVTLKRFDLKNNCVIGEDRIFDIPNMVVNPNDTTYWKYNSARADKLSVPEFSEDAQVSVLSVGKNEVELTFPAVQKTLSDDDYMIASYRVKVLDKALQSKAADIVLPTDDYYLPASMRNTTITKKITSLNSNTEYTAEISALDVWGNESEVISCDFTTDKDEGDEEETVKYNNPQSDERNPQTKYIKSVKEGETEATANYTEFNGVSRGPFKDSRGPGEYFVTFYEAEMYITFEFDVEKSGMYEIMTETDSISNATLRPVVDGLPRKPVTLIGKGVWYNIGTVYSSLGKIPLEAGTHTITIQAPEKLSAELHLWSVSLAKVADAHVIDMFCSEGTAWAGHYSDYSKNKNAYAYQFYGDGYGGIDFEFEAPINGQYIISVEAAGGSADNTFSVSIDGTQQTSINVSAGTTSTIGTFIAEDVINIEKGTRKLTLLSGKSSAIYFRSVTIISYDSGDLWNVFETSGGNITGFSGGNSGDTNLSDGLIMMASGNGYITYQVTPSKTGKYNISWKLLSTGGFYAKTLLDGEAINDETYYKNDKKDFTAPVNTILVAGNTYEITLKAVTSGHAYVYAMKLEYTGEPDNGGEGVNYDIYVGDSIEDNYENLSASGIKYGDGRSGFGWGCYGGLYSEFKVNTEFAGWYDITLVLGSAAGAQVKLTIDGVDYAEKTSAFVEGENWSIRRNNDFGQIFFMPGEHTFRITGLNGTFMIYKTRFAFNRADDGIGDLSFKYDCLAYTDKGGSNVQVYTKPYGGIMLGEGNSYAEYTVYVPEGNYAFELCYGAKDWDGQVSVTLNNNLLGTYPLPQTNTSIFQELYDVNAYYTPEILSLKEGRNTIKIQCERFADYQEASGYAYFSFSSFKLTRITTPYVSMYAGEDITPYTKATTLMDGTMTVKASLPRVFEDENVTMYVALYKGNRLYKAVSSDTIKANTASDLTAKLTDIVKEDGASYSCRFYFLDLNDNMIPLCNAVDF